MSLTPLYTVDQLKEMFAESMINKSTKVTKVSDDSVFSGMAFGVAKTAQKAIKDIALIESNLFPDEATGTYLDEVAQKLGISDRFTELGSSTYVRIIADVGTSYLQTGTIITGSHGVEFELTEDVTIGATGYTFALVRSTSQGIDTNVDPNTLVDISPVPSGHQYINNDYMAQGGRDQESDDTFRKRIKEGPNVLARGTLAYLTQVLLKVNTNVLRVYYQGVNTDGKDAIAVATQNGSNLTSSELTALAEQASEYLSISELKPYGYNNIGVAFSNMSWYQFDMDIRLKLESGYDPDEVRKNIQIRISKYLDWRFWEYNKKVEWDDLLQIVKSTKGVKYVLDQYFTPSSDLTVPPNQLPRLRGFVMRDSNGNVIESVTGTINPIYYPNENDISFQETVLTTI